MHNQLLRCIAVFIIIMGFSAMAQALTFDINDADPVAGSVDIGAGDSLHYTHNIVDDGYNPATDQILNALLSVQLTDDTNEFVGTVMFDFEGSDEEELSVHEGDQVVILSEIGEWLYVRNDAGDEGYVPTAYVEGYGHTNAPTSFQLFFDGILQGTYNPAGSGFFEFTVPSGYLTDGSLNLDFYGISNAFSFDYANLFVTVDRSSEPVPEPATLLLFSSGCVGLAGIRSRRKKKQQI